MARKDIQEYLKGAGSSGLFQGIYYIILPCVSALIPSVRRNGAEGFVATAFTILIIQFSIWLFFKRRNKMKNQALTSSALGDSPQNVNNDAYLGWFIGLVIIVLIALLIRGFSGTNVSNMTVEKSAVPIAIAAPLNFIYLDNTNYETLWLRIMNKPDLLNDETSAAFESGNYAWCVVFGEQYKTNVINASKRENEPLIEAAKLAQNPTSVGLAIFHKNIVSLMEDTKKDSYNGKSRPYLRELGLSFSKIQERLPASEREFIDRQITELKTLDAQAH